MDCDNRKSKEQVEQVAANWQAYPDDFDQRNKEMVQKYGVGTTALQWAFPHPLLLMRARCQYNAQVASTPGSSGKYYENKQ